MTVNRTTLLDLPLPVTGTESGTWGDTTNNGLTQYLDIAIAGTLVLSTDADVTLTSTEGDSSATNIGATTAQYAILRWTATGSTTRNITALAQSKTYVVINATGGTQSIVLRGAGPTTGVTIISGEKALCVWNGSDFVKVSSSAAAGGSNTQVQYNSSGVLAGSSNLTFDGTSLTLGGNPTLSGGIANGVLYLNGSKVATSGSALTFDGTNFKNTTGYVSALTDFRLNDASYTRVGVADAGGGFVGGYNITYSTSSVRYDSTGSIAGIYYNNGGNIQFFAGGSAVGGAVAPEQMRLTSTGLGIGTSSPAYKLHVQNSAANTDIFVGQSSTVGLFTQWRYNATAASAYGEISTYGGNNSVYIQAQSGGGNTILNLQSGNLGIGTSSPGVKLTVSYTAAAGNIAHFAGANNVNGYIGAHALSNGGLYINSNQANQDLRLQTQGTDRVILDSSGNLGLGVTPSAWGSGYSGLQLGLGLSLMGSSVNGNFAANCYFDGTNWRYVQNTFANNFYVNYANNGSFVWATAPSGTAGNTITFTQAMTLDASGNLGIGTSSPSAKLHVQNQVYVKGTGGGDGAIGIDINSGASAVTTSAHAIRSGGGTGNSLIIETQTANSNGQILFQTNGSERARIDSSGNLIGAGTTSIIYWEGVYNNTTASAANMFVASNGSFARSTSSLKYKTDVQDAVHGLADVLKLRPVTYKGKSASDGDAVFGGLIAEEVHEAGLTEFVQYAEDGSPDALAYGNMVSLCIKAIQEQQALISSLTARVTLLEGN